ncbi:MAG: SAM-dependent methyltransferase [Calditerrivibrio sp.]|nr:SAM-dependent methyltransferase [Calditerrivibrio sp.]
MLVVAGLPLDFEYYSIPEDLKDIIRNASFVIGEEKKNVLRVLARCDARDKEFLLLNEHTKASDYHLMIKKIKDKDVVVMFSDGGTPCIADPGYKFIDACYNNGVEVIAYPGPSSITSAISISGFFAESFYFAGFLPKEKKELQSFIKKIDELNETTVILERPYAIKNMVDFLLLTKKRKIFFAVNIGMPNFISFRGTVQNLLNFLSKNDKIKAPFVVVLEKIC